MAWVLSKSFSEASEDGLKGLIMLFYSHFNHIIIIL